MKRLAVALTVVALITPILLGLHPSTASAGVIFKNASISIHQLAQLVGTTEVDVTVTYDCAPVGTNTGGDITVNVDQNGVHGHGEMVSPAGICDDKSHTTTIQVTGGLFVQGPANAFAEVGNVDFSAFAQQDAEISIK